MNQEIIYYSKHFLKPILHYASNIQALIISSGAILGGFWTYLLFIRQRLHYPKINLNMEINKTDLGNTKKLIHVEIVIANIGGILFKTNYAELRLRQILPIEDKDLLSTISQGLDPVKNNNTHIEWPCFAQREWKKEFEIEPGEPDNLHADFFIGNNIQIGEFYFYLKNSKKKNQLGWSLTKIFKF
jgi:hypothetical protein